MKHLGDARVEALALGVVEALGRSGKITVNDRGAAVRAATARLKSAFQLDPGLDQAVRRRIASLSRQVPEGGREWELLYQQYFDELSRRGGS